MKWAVFIKWIVLHYSIYKSENRKMEKPHHPSCSGEDVLLLLLLLLHRVGLRQPFVTPVQKRQQWICLCTQVLNISENYSLSYATVVALNWWKSDGKIDWKNHFSLKLIFNLKKKKKLCSRRVVLTILFSSLSFEIQSEDEELHHNDTAITAEKNWASVFAQWAVFSKQHGFAQTSVGKLCISPHFSL